MTRLRCHWALFRKAWGNGSRWKILSWMLAVAVTANVVTIAWVAADHTDPDPFGDYPTQQITGLPEQQVEVVNEAATTVKQTLPVADVDAEAITVVGSKCVDADVPVDVRGNVSWRMVSPVVQVIPNGTGSATRNPGCESFTFRNPIPEQVRGAARAQAEAGHPVTIWQVTGTEEVTSNGWEGTQTWQTENFAIEVSGVEAG